MTAIPGSGGGITVWYDLYRAMAPAPLLRTTDTMSLYPGDRGAFADAPGLAQHGESRAMHPEISIYPPKCNQFCPYTPAKAVR